jgi:hypothetical protein
VKVGQEKVPVTAVAMPLAPNPTSRPLRESEMWVGFKVSEPVPSPSVQLAGAFPDAVMATVAEVGLAIWLNGRLPAWKGGSTPIWIL